MKLVAWSADKLAYRGPMHSTAELAREIGLTVRALGNHLKVESAPKPVRKWSTKQSVNRGCNYYNRTEVLAFLRQIGVIE